MAGLIGTGICYAVGWFGGAAIINTIKENFQNQQNPLRLPMIVLVKTALGLFV